MLMALGLYVFSIPTLAHQDLQRRTDWRYARGARVGARDSAQYVGPGDDTITLAGCAAAEIVDGLAEIDTLRGMADQGAGWPLLDGSGRVYGTFVILSIDERHRHLLADGTPRAIDFTIELGHVDDAGDGTAAVDFGGTI